MKIVFEVENKDGLFEWTHEIPIHEVENYLKIVKKYNIMDEEGNLYTADKPQYDVNHNVLMIGLEAIE